jgi:hypothetical protein
MLKYVFIVLQGYNPLQVITTISLHFEKNRNFENFKMLTVF